jgi:uncharacterized protein
MHRRTVLKGLAASTAATAVIGPDLFRGAWAARAEAIGDGPFGPPTVDTGFGFRVPEGFSVRVVAVGGEEVPGTGYTWHPASDGAGTYATPDGGWILTSNSEVNSDDVSGGASAIRFGPPGPDGVAPIEDAYRILGQDVGTPSAGNCAGGVTPWGTWFSCEENAGAQHVWECDPTGVAPAIELPQLGRFAHEAAVVDPFTGIVYLTEDTGDSRFFRWVPDVAPGFGERPDFDRGQLQVMALSGPEALAGAGPATWIDVDAFDPRTYRPLGSTSFVRGEGIWYHDRVVYWVASTFSQIFAYDTRTDTQEILHDPGVVGSEMNDADNLCVHPMTGDLYITEDAPQSIGIDVLIITAPDEDGNRTVAPVIRAAPGQHAGSEFTGPVFDPSGTRFYFASQRMSSPNDPTNVTAGVIYEVTGPFLRAAQAQEPAPTTTTTAPPPSPSAPDEPSASEPQADPQPQGAARLPETGGGDLVGWAGLGVGAVGWWAARRARVLADHDVEEG